MNIHEFQAKKILESFGIPVPPFFVAKTIEEVEAGLKEWGWEQAVIKIQVHAGGRGKGGGVKLAKSRREALDYAKQLLGMRLINKQTGPQGVVASTILITPLIAYAKEFYVAAVIDRSNAQGMLIVSPEGGMEIEEVAAKHPERILKIPMSLEGKLRGYHLRAIAKFLGWTEKVAEQGGVLLPNLAKAFVGTDASVLEINPLVLTNQGDLIALDAKLSVDDNALYRQQKIASYEDPTQMSPLEVQAKKYDLAYVALDGQIGCMVNGAGLAMATMDIIHLYGGVPANFLDVGGGASEEKVAQGFKIILSDPKVKAILVNIFGGIMNCATLAGGIIAAAAEHQVKVPLIIRMEGTNVDQGKKMLAEAKLNILLADTMGEAAERAVKAAKDYDVHFNQ